MRDFPHLFLDIARQLEEAVRAKQEAYAERCRTEVRLRPARLRSAVGAHHTTPGHHDADSSARLGPVKAFRFAPTPYGAHGLDRTLRRANGGPLRDGRVVMNGD
jgi:hypothetical protein